MEHHVLPAFRDHGVRYVQLARSGPLERDGVDVLSDSRHTERLVMAGVWTLADELERAGTVPQFAHGQRRCSQKFKGWPIDHWLRSELGEAAFRHVVGFNADERWRVSRDRSYATSQRSPEYPLVEWGWTRDDCVRYLQAVTGETWRKSCCTFCLMWNGAPTVRRPWSPSRGRSTRSWPGTTRPGVGCSSRPTSAGHPTPSMRTAAPSRTTCGSASSREPTP